MNQIIYRGENSKTDDRITLHTGEGVSEPRPIRECRRPIVTPPTIAPRTVHRIGDR